MKKKELSRQAHVHKEVIKYLLGHGEYRTPKEIEAATGITVKEITRSLSDIRLSEAYITRSLGKPFRVRVQCVKKINELWNKALSGGMKHENNRKTTP
jgi:hypothetical protein